MDNRLVDFGGSGPQVLFLHANGYPPGCYQPFFSHLAPHYHIKAMVQRPLWIDSQPDDFTDWLPLTEDLLEMQEKALPEPHIGIGHSMGGIAILRAALRTPERFRAIVLLDPVFFPPFTILVWRLIHALGLEDRFHPLVPAARNRRQSFDDLDRLFQGYRRKPIFRYMDENALWAYITSIACPTETGYRLCYPPDWETRIYTTSVWRDMDIWRSLPGLQPPTLILRGEETDTFWSSTGRLVRRKQPRIQIMTVKKSTHLLPLERPAEVAECILSFLQECL